MFTLDFKAEVVRHKKAENLSTAICARKFDVLPKLLQRGEKQYEAGELTVSAGRRAVSPEQAEITRLRAELSQSKITHHHVGEFDYANALVWQGRQHIPHRYLAG